MSERLSTLQPRTRSESLKRHTFFIRWLRLLLPLAALAIISLVFLWPELSDTSLTSDSNTNDERRTQRILGQNELTNPRFESRDSNGQPYSITADRAVQASTNDDLVILEQPTADMMLSNGNWVAIEAKEGAFRQDVQNLMLQDDVRLFHDLGYQLRTTRLYIDMPSETAWTEEAVDLQGPEGSIQAAGMKADRQNEILIFNGPAHLTLDEGLEGFE